jgi:hypothetical protein
MTYVRPMSVTYGVCLLALGVCGFIPPLLGSPVPGAGDRILHVLDGTLFGWYHVNVILSGLYLLLGVLGLMMTIRPSEAKLYAKFVTVIFALLAILGAIPQTSTLFGLAPLQHGDIALHTFLAVVAFPFAFILPAKVPTTEVGQWPPEQGMPQS